MPLNYLNLDEQTRKHMLAECNADNVEGVLYVSDNLNQQGKNDYPSLLITAIQAGSDDTLASEIRLRLNTHEKPRKLKNGEMSKAPVMRANAHTMLSEGEFNRFYIRGVCSRACAEGIEEVVVYRARHSDTPRPGSEEKIGMRISASALLEDLRKNIGFETYLGLPGGPNSGLSVRLPESQDAPKSRQAESM